jgi:hypothetical protein
MPRALSLLAVLALAGPAAAQDVPLWTFAPPGEGWAKVGGPKPAAPPTADPPAPPSKPTCSAARKDGTVFVGFADQFHVWAYRTTADGTLDAGQPYCTLRTPVPSDRDLRRAKAKPVPVTSLTTDADGRIYAATPLGIQVFDPTGRLSGVLLPPAAGELTHLGWEGDRLVVWAGDTKYARRMNAKGK